MRLFHAPGKATVPELAVGEELWTLIFADGATIDLVGSRADIDAVRSTDDLRGVGVDSPDTIPLNLAMRRLP